MKIVRGLFVSLIVLVLLLGIVGFFLPSQVHVERRIEIAAPASAIYDVVTDFRQFNQWSPWRDLDPDATYEITGTDRAIGSKFAWFSDKPEVGNGSQTITALEPDRSMGMRLEFEGQKPADSFFRLTPGDQGTIVVWGFDTDLGANPFMHYFSLIIDRLLGPTFDDGLLRLKKYIETDPKT
jgi:hypothetical protein